MMDPIYQRESDIWTMDRRQLLIDTIINGFDIPKIYLHKFSNREPNNGGYDYAVIDGKQRFSAIWGFIDGSFPLSDDFVYLDDPDFDLSSKTYGDIARDYPEVRAIFDAYTLDVVTIETSDLELIEDMFSRLNEATPLNAAEKRNARKGPIPGAVRNLVSKSFFKSNLPFSNKRYRHLDIAAKMLFLSSRGEIYDTKKAYIDRFFETHENSDQTEVDIFLNKTMKTLASMERVFIENDPLLRSVGMVILYYIVFERAIEAGTDRQITRHSLVEFKELREKNRALAESDIVDADYTLLEFDRFAQSPNDAIALRYRLDVINKKVFFGRLFGEKSKE